MFPELIAFAVINFHVNFIYISIFPKTGSTPESTIVIIPGEGITVDGNVT